MTRHTEAQIQEALLLVPMTRPTDAKAFEKQLRADNAGAWFVVHNMKARKRAEFARTDERRRNLMMARDKALAAGDVATFQSITTQIADLPMAGIAPLTQADKTRYANRKVR